MDRETALLREDRMPQEIVIDDNGDPLCPDCATTNIIKRPDKRGNVNYFCTNCGWARLGNQDFPGAEKRDLDNR